MRDKAPEEPATTLEEMIEAAHARGPRINNLFQVENGWRANVHGGKQFYEFGEGKQQPQPFTPRSKKQSAQADDAPGSGRTRKREAQ